MLKKTSRGTEGVRETGVQQGTTYADGLLAKLVEAKKTESPESTRMSFVW